MFLSKPRLSNSFDTPVIIESSSENNRKATSLGLLIFCMSTTVTLLAPAK